MRIVASSTATVTSSCSPVVRANVHATHDSTVATGLEQVSNFPQLQRPVQPVIQSGLPTTATRPLFMQPAAAAAGMATSAPTPAWPVSQWSAATSAQPDTPATHIAPTSLPAVSEVSGFCQPLPAAATASHGIKQGSRCTRVVRSWEQSPQTIEALQEWHRMTPEERAEKSCLYDFLKSQGAPMVDAKRHRLVAATVAQFEWLMRRETGLPLPGYGSFLEKRGPKSPLYVLAEGLLTELGAELFGPILREAGLDVPPVAESMRAWRKRVRPLIERWCVEDLSTPQPLNEFVDEHSPGRTATQTQKMQLITLEFYLMSQDASLRQKGQWHKTRTALATAHGFPEINLRFYIGQRGALPPASPLWELLPTSLQGQARPVTKRQARWRDRVRPLVAQWVAQWCASSAPGREPLRKFVERSLPKRSGILGQGVQLVALHYYLMKKFPEAMGEEVEEGEEQSADSLKLEGFAEAQSVKSAAVRRYVLDCGRLQGLGKHFELLVPQSLSKQARGHSVAAGLGPHAVPGGEPEAVAAQIPGAPATQGMVVRTHAVAGDGQSLAPASKRMRMEPEVLQSTVFHAFAPVPTPPTPQWDAATNAQPDTHTTRIALMSIPVMVEEASDALPQGYFAVLGNSGHLSPQLVHAENALSADTVAAMEPTPPAWPVLPQWDAATNAESDTHTTRVALMSMPAMSEASDALPQGYLAVLGNSGHLSPQLVHAENALSADAVAAMAPILATDPPTVVDEYAIVTMPDPDADLPTDSLAELDCDWDDIDSRIAAYRGQW